MEITVTITSYLSDDLPKINLLKDLQSPLVGTVNYFLSKEYILSYSRLSIKINLDLLPNLLENHSFLKYNNFAKNSDDLPDEVLFTLFSCNQYEGEWDTFQSILKNLENTRGIRVQLWLTIAPIDMTVDMEEFRYGFYFEFTNMKVNSYDPLEEYIFKSLDEFYECLHYKLPSNYNLCKDSIPFPKKHFQSVKSSNKSYNC